MSIRWREFAPGALAALAVLLGLFLVSPASHAGDAVILVPEEDRNVPEGSQIPDWRIEETEGKVRDFNERMRQVRPAQQDQQLPQVELPKADAGQP